MPSWLQALLEAKLDVAGGTGGGDCPKDGGALTGGAVKVRKAAAVAASLVAPPRADQGAPLFLPRPFTKREKGPLVPVHNGL
jgi:hypothetical protein